MVAQTAGCLAARVLVSGYSLHLGLPLPSACCGSQSLLVSRGQLALERGKVFLLAFEFPKKPLAWTHVPGKSNAFQHIPPQRGKDSWREKERGRLAEAWGLGAACSTPAATPQWRWHLQQQQRPSPMDRPV